MNIQTYNPGSSITRNWIALNPKKVIAILIHHAEASKASPDDLNRWHINNGWSGVGYNEYIRKDGTVYICRGMNIGAQCMNWNSKTYGICLEGDFMKEAPSQLQLQVLVERIRQLLPSFPNLQEIAPHSKYFPTACPGKLFPMDMVKRMLGDELYGSVLKLQKGAIIGSPTYWQQNAVAGSFVKSSYIQIVIINAVTYFTAQKLDAVAAVNKLAEAKIISSPDYWIDCITTGQDVRGDFAAILIKNIASRM